MKLVALFSIERHDKVIKIICTNRFIETQSFNTAHSVDAQGEASEAC